MDHAAEATATARTRCSTPSARLAILISGRGSNMLAIARACAEGRLAARVVGVVADRPEAAGLDAARALGLVTRVVERRRFPTPESFDRALDEALVALAPDLVALAGFMRVLGAPLVERWRGRMVNIHPSLLPKYRGLDTHARALAAGDAEHGASVHFVVPELDAGEVIARARVPVLPGDTPERLAARVLVEEHRLYVTALARLIDTLPACREGCVNADTNASGRYVNDGTGEGSNGCDDDRAADGVVVPP